MAPRPPGVLAVPVTAFVIRAYWRSSRGKAMTGSEMSCFLRFIKASMAASAKGPPLYLESFLVSLNSDKATFDQLTPTEQKLWTTFETVDIYRFLTGEEDSAQIPVKSDFCSKTSTSGAVNNKHITHACQYISSGSSSGTTTTSSLSTKLRFEYITSNKHATLLTNSFHFRDQAKATTTTNGSTAAA